jgi:outer membrane protein assembly factor BamB
MRNRSATSAVSLLIAVGLLTTGGLVVTSASPDWPQFLGPGRNGVYNGPPLAATWPSGGPKKVWQKSVGEGFAGPAVAGDRVILFHRVMNQEVVEALDAKTGDSRWRYAYPTTYRDDFGFDEGPRAVPVVANGRVYTFGAEGRLSAVDLATGQKVWDVDTMRRFNVRKGFFGAAGSPIVENGRVIANIGGKDGAKGAGIVAFNADTGAVLWTATDHDASYSSGVSATFAGQPTVVFFTRNGLVGLDPSNGVIRFQRQWRSRLAASVNAATPLIVGDTIFVSATYGTGAAAIQVQGGQLKDLWSGDEILSNHYASAVYSNGILYGYHGRQEFNPSFRAVDFKTGAVKWNVDAFHAGSVTLAGDRLLILKETGELILAAATPQAYRPLAQAQILPMTARSMPALSDGFLYARNNDTHKDVLVCLDLR